MIIRDAKASDKSQILEFCKNTFSWGDYIEDVWSYWNAEKNLFVVEDSIPIGFCHAFFSIGQVWIEGIRVNPMFRRKHIATDLVKHVESVGKNRKVSSSFMLIDMENSSSLSMAHSLDYNIIQTWNFYSLQPSSTNNFRITFESLKSVPSHYVKSWRWLPLDDITLQELYSKNQIISSDVNEDVSSCIITDSEHFDKTMIVTLFSGSMTNTVQLFSYLQNLASEKNYKRIQILTKETLQKFTGLEKRISFHLMKKPLN